MTGNRAVRWQVLVAFAVVYVVWGSTYLGIRYAIESIPPLLMAGTRFLLAGMILFAVRLRQTAERPQLVHWRSALVLGFLLVLCGNGGVTWAEQRITSGMAALLITSEPLWIVVLNGLRPRGRRPSVRELLGVLVGFGGVALLLAPQLTTRAGGAGGTLLWSSLLVIGSALAWAVGSLYGINAPSAPDRPMQNGMTMLVGGALLLVTGLSSGEGTYSHLQHITLTSAAAWAYLTIFGSLAAFSAYVFLMQNTAPAKASTYAFVNPVVAVLLGWGIAGEPIDVRSGVAIAIIVGAVMLITFGQPAAKPQVQEPPLKDFSTASEELYCSVQRRA